MSKISQIHAELEEAAAELGFSSLSEAQEAGCVVEWHENSAELVEPLEAAHRALLKEKEEVLEDLGHLKNIYKDVKPDEQVLEHAIKFIEENCDV